MKTAGNLEFWKEHGDSVLVVQPFMDSLIVGGDGCYLIDIEGRRILDLAAGQFCSILGHNHPRFVSRVQEQVGKLVHLGDQYLSPNVLLAAERLASICPIANAKVLLLSTGSEANECAMRIAKAVTGRTGMLGYSRGYYGISLATRNLSSISEHVGKVDFEPAPVGQYKLLSPCDRHCPIGLVHDTCSGACLDASFELLGERAETVAAVIVEPILSAGGMLYPSSEYLRALHARTRDCGALFIVDEAQTGLGRCGAWFDIQNHGIEPDIVIVSKTAGNGYPIGGVVVSEPIARRLEAQGFTHLSSHQNDPLAAAALHAVIDIVEEEKLVEHSARVGAYFLERLLALKAKHSLIADVRGRGLMIAMELRTDESTPADLALRFALHCERRGLHITYTYYEPVIRFIPPLIITEGDVDAAIATIDAVLSALLGDRGSVADLLPKNVRSGPFVQRGQQRLTPMKIVRGLWNNPPREWLGKFSRR